MRVGQDREVDAFNPFYGEKTEQGTGSPESGGRSSAVNQDTDSPVRDENGISLSDVDEPAIKKTFSPF
jgi:hypothetical protein